MAAVLAVLAVSLGGAGNSLAAITLPPANSQFDYQIGGAYSPLSSVAIVDRDRFDPAVAGRYNICYVNSYQTQPGGDAGTEGTAAWWKANHNNLLLRDNRGRYVSDPGYPDEILLDTRTSGKRSAIASIMGRWYDQCATDEFQAVEPDNLDSWTRSRRYLTKANNVALARLLVTEAHEANLAVAQKNTTEVLGAGIGFDFAVAEECHVYDECNDYMDVYGAQVYEIEYTDNGGRTNFNAACADHGQISIVYRDRDVVPAGAPGYVYDWC